MKKVLATSLLILTLILIGTVAAIMYGKGYRFTFGSKNATPLQGTGLMVLTSKPDVARVFINGHLTTATNNTINLDPGDYDVKIEKDGYLSWSKKISVKKEIVSQADAYLFPIAPQLESITTTGANNLAVNSTGSIIAYTVASSSSATKNGIYILDMNASPLPLVGGAVKQLTNTVTDDFANATFSFSPDGTELLATVKKPTGDSYYLVSTQGFNDTPTDITNTISLTLKDWEKQTADKNTKTIQSLPSKLRTFAKANFENINFSPEDDKFVYTASSSATIPQIITPKIPGANSTPEQREIIKGNIYVYDIKEDRNYLIFDSSTLGEDAKEPSFNWYYSDRHLLFVQGQKVNVVEFDGLNKTTIYAGPFADSFVFPWPNTSGVVILTNLNIPDAPYNLYRINLK